jgi:cobalt-zinc-cadmium efflux system protein
MFADVCALGISVFALRLAQRPPTASKTFGYHRGEILAAFVNGLVLWLIVGLIVREAYERVLDPPVVHGVGMIGIAIVGLGVNLVSLWVLRHSQAGSLNVRAAFVHVIGDALGSVGAIFAGVAILAWGWSLADPLVSIGIGLLILFSSWGIVRESVDILMQGTPREMRLEDIEQCLLGVPGVCEVHDLHVWTLTSGRYLLSVHLVAGTDDAARPDAARRIIDAAQTQLRDRFGIGHTTVQVDSGEQCTEEFREH